MNTKSGRIAKFSEYLWYLLFEQIYKRNVLLERKRNQNAAHIVCRQKGKTSAGCYRYIKKLPTGYYLGNCIAHFLRYQFEQEMFSGCNVLNIRLIEVKHHKIFSQFSKNTIYKKYMFLLKWEKEYVFVNVTFNDVVEMFGSRPFSFSFFAKSLT